MKFKVLVILFLFSIMGETAWTAEWNTSGVLEVDKMDFGEKSTLLYGAMNFQPEESSIAISLETLLDDASDFHFYKAFMSYSFEVGEFNFSLGPKLYSGFDGEKIGGKGTIAFDSFGINWSAFGYFLQPFDGEENIFAEISFKASKKLPWMENLSGFFQTNFMDFGGKSVQLRPGFCLESWCMNANIMVFDGDEETTVGAFVAYLF